MNEIEELLTFPVVARYKVIADYPGNYLIIGYVIELRCGNDQRFHTGKYIEPYAYTDNGALTEAWLKSYPHLFEQL